MNILNIIDTIYESKYFPTILLISILVLVFLFVVVIILGIKDSKRTNEPKKERLQDLKDITFDTPNEKETIKEDVVFEIPVLTKNLENFKKSLEEEIEREEQVHVVKKEAKLKEETKPTKILDKDEIDNTAVIPVINIETLEEPTKEEKEEEERPPKREILKELFKNRKPKEVEPPKVKGDQLEDPIIKEEKKVTQKENALSKKVEQQKIEQPKKKIEQPAKELKKEEPVKKEEPRKVEPTPVLVKKETRYSGDDDF